MVMRMTKHLRNIILFGLVIIYSCAPAYNIPDMPENPVTDEDLVHVALVKKAQAIVDRDKEKYLETIDAGNMDYFLESKAWIEQYLDIKTEGYTLKIKDIQKIDKKTIVAEIEQRYYFVSKIKRGIRKDNRIIHLTEKYIKKDKGWVDSGPYFIEKRTENFMIKVMGGVESGEMMTQVEKSAEDAYDLMMKSYGKEVKGLVRLNAYRGQKALANSGHISRASAVAGNYGTKYGGIKLAYRKNDIESMTQTITHELIHRVTLSNSQKIPDWFTEGLAVHYGSYAGRNETYLSEGIVKRKEIAKPISWFKNKHQHTNTEYENKIYYAMAGMVVKYLDEEYGLDKVKQILKGLSKYGDHRSDFPTTRAYEKALQRNLDKEIEKVSGLKKSEFNQNWLEWIAKQ